MPVPICLLSFAYKYAQAFLSALSHALYSNTMVEPNHSFHFDLNEPNDWGDPVADDPIDPNAPVNWDTIAEDVLIWMIHCLTKRSKKVRFKLSFVFVFFLLLHLSH
jgi:hypothetical protein